MVLVIEVQVPSTISWTKEMIPLLVAYRDPTNLYFFLLQIGRGVNTKKKLILFPELRSTKYSDSVFLCCLQPVQYIISRKPYVKIASI